jgi:predicted  nucleic acid-binding Zn-ribbon protein
MSYRKTLFLNDSDNNNSIKLFLSHDGTNGAATLRTDGTDMPLNLISNRVNLQGQQLQLTKTDVNGNVSGEVINAYDKFVTLTSDLASEASTARQAESTNSTNISQNTLDISNNSTNININASHISTEVFIARSTETSLESRINSANSERSTLSSDISTSLSTERFDRASADTSLETKISDMLQGAPDALDNLAELKVAFESADFEVVRVQNTIINRVNKLSEVLSLLTTDLEGGEVAPDWAGELSFVDMTLIDQDPVGEPTAPAQ